MNFNEFIKKGLVRPAKKDPALITSLIKMAENDLEFLKKLEINVISARKIMSDYYDIIRCILEAISLNKGYKIYSHEALTYLLKEMNEESLSIKFDRLRKIRNKINYYGHNILPEETKNNIQEITSMIKILKHKYLKNL